MKEGNPPMKLDRIGISAASLLLLAAPLAAHGLSTHTWVSATGNDANSGTASSPYADFATAAANTAAGGTVSVLGPGDYGPVTITQSITIDGTGGGSINFVGLGEGIYVDTGAAANIVLRNISINGGGTGSDAIYIASSGTTNVINVVIDGCLISGFSQIGVGLGSESPMYVTVRNTTIQGGTLGVRTFQNGITAPVTNYDHVSLDHVTVQGATSAGVFTRNGNLDISNSNISGNTGTGVPGLEADTSATLNVQNSMITSNTNGVCIFTNSTAVVNETNVADNATNFEVCGGEVEGAGGAGPAPAEEGARSATAAVPPDKPRLSKLRK
jgi:hypothetical protein